MQALPNQSLSKGNPPSFWLAFSLSLFCLFGTGTPARAIHEGKVQILLLGDSTTEAKIPKMVEPDKPQFEDLIRILLESEKDLPPTHVINLGLSGESIHRLLDSGRYDKEVPHLPGIDYVFIRYGINDKAKRENFESNFPLDFHDLLGRLRRDHPKALLIPMTVIPFSNEATSKEINDLVRAVAAKENLALFDIYPRYAKELEKGFNMLNYRRFPLAKVPESFHVLVKPYLDKSTLPSVVVLDNRLDAHLGHLPGWFGDRHPNHAGYHVLADETAKYLSPILRQRHPASAVK